jgi:glutathionyl-hydroquinone reductase
VTSFLAIPAWSIDELGLFCPFAHRVNLVRHLKGLQDIIDISIVKPYPKGNDKGWPGWRFPTSDEEYQYATVDQLFGSKYLHEIYFKADEGYKGRYSVPVLWDKKTGTIVNNVRLLNPSLMLSLTTLRKAVSSCGRSPSLSTAYSLQTTLV